MITWRKEDMPAGYAGTMRIGPNTWFSRCRACDVEHVEHGALPYPRYMGIGRHEADAHGLPVPGINVGMLP